MQRSQVYRTTFGMWGAQVRILLSRPNKYSRFKKAIGEATQLLWKYLRWSSEGCVASQYDIMWKTRNGNASRVECLFQYWCISSVGQSATLSRQKSRVRAPYTPQIQTLSSVGQSNCLLSSGAQVRILQCLQKYMKQIIIVKGKW